MKNSRHLTYSIIVVLVILISLIVAPAASKAAPDNSPDGLVKRAWELAQQSGRYHFVTRLEQTTYPAPTIANAGKSSRVESISLDGDADLPAGILRMRLWQNGDSLANGSDSAEILIDGTDAYGRAGSGEWQEIDNFSDSLAPGNDALGFLAAARNVEMEAPDGISPGNVIFGASGPHFTFDLSGPALADYMRVELEEQMRSSGELPPGIRLASSEALRDTVGTGDLWLDGAGYPLRLSLHIQYPQQRSGERVEVEISSDFSNFNTEAIAQSGWDKLASSLVSLNGSGAASSEVLASMTVLGFLSLVLINCQSKKVYLAIVILVIASMVVTPLLQSAQVYAFYQEQQEQQARDDVERVHQESQQALDDALTSSSWDPHTDPFASAEAEQTLIQHIDSVAGTSSAANPLIATNALPPRQASAADDPQPDSDKDNDGLTYAQEMLLGTDPEDKDTDDDQITDNAEVEGFQDQYGTWWYSDPLSPDTNNDGLTDNLECPQQARDGSDAVSPSGVVCQDSDGDGSFDLFDRDNDDDGVPDRVDLAPFESLDNDGVYFNSDAPLLLQVDGLQADMPVFVDFQLRPKNEDHLWHALNVLDWPSGDENGQIQRKNGNDSTYEDFMSGTGMADIRGANGDLRLVPMIEIIIPYKDGHYANLPVKAGAPITRTQSMTVGQWLDTEVLDPYGIAVRDINEVGDLSIYAPISLVSDETGDDRVAFSARMHYWPTLGNASQTTSGSLIADWGNTQQVRLVWLVQMLVDSPCMGDNCESDWILDQNQIVHVYNDSWTLTGLTVREDHGLDVAVIYEDPSEEHSAEARQYDDWLWTMSYGLDAVFLTGRDCYPMEDGECKGDGERDMPIAEISARFDNRLNAGTTDEERWGIPITATQVATFTYPHQDFAAYIMMTETQKILDLNFSPYLDQGSDAPTLLFAQESQYRMAALGDDTAVVQGGNQLTLEIDQDKSELEVHGVMSWAPYRYNRDSSEWESYPIDDYWDLMEVRFNEIFTEYKDDPHFEELRQTEVRFAQMFYLALFHGRSAMLQNGADIVGLQAVAKTDIDLAEVAPEPGLIGGGTARGVKAIAGTIGGIISLSVGDANQAYRDRLEQLRALLDSSSAFAAQKKSLRNAYLKDVGLTLLASTMLVLYYTLDYVGGRPMYLTLRSIDTVWSVYGSVTLGGAIYDKWHKLHAIYDRYGPNKLKSLLKKDFKSTFSKAFWIGFILAEGVQWGMAIAEMVDANLQGMALNYAIAAQLASTITALLLVVLASIPIFGQAIAGIIGLFDQYVLLICAISESENPICNGVSGWIAQGVLYIIYGSRVMLRMGKGDRLNILSIDQQLVNPDDGMIVGAGLVVSTTVQNNVELIELGDETGHDWKAALYWWQYSSKTLRSSTFRYHLPTSQVNYHEGLKRFGIPSYLWEPSACNPKEDGCTYEDSLSGDANLPEPGINRPLQLYLAESYAIPAQECWGPIPVCYIRTERKTTHIKIGNNIIFDVFPATLDEFYTMAAKNGGYSLAWSLDSTPAFPRQKDADGDGLVNKVDGGPDPNDSLWDTDNDRLSDYHEIQLGSNPQLYDTDNDGLSDYDEIIYQTDPLRTDTDYDGLMDSEEVEGWEFVYDFAADGTQITTWVTSDPLNIDADGDQLTDFQEKTYGFNPRVTSDPDVLTLESLVRESGAPRLLLRLDELASASAFQDDSGYGNSGFCEGDACPASGHTGMYQNAVHFDGIDDKIAVNAANTEDLQEFTLAAWVNPDTLPSSVMRFVNLADEKAVLRFDNGDLHFYVQDDQSAFHEIRVNGALSADTWQHIAGTFDGSTLRLYLDGIVISSQPFSGTLGDGEGLQLSHAAETMEGYLDEVVFFDEALSQPEIEDLMGAHYNAADLIVKPGDTLYYESRVTNHLFNRYAQGLLSIHTPSAVSTDIPPDAFILNPHSEKILDGEVAISSAAVSGVYSLTQEVDAMITDWRQASDYAEQLFHFSEEITSTTTFVDSSGSQPPRDGECSAPGCPSTVDGPNGSALALDGLDDYVSADSVLEYINGDAVSVGAWVYPTADMAADGAVLAFNDADGEQLNTVYFDYDDHWFYYYDQEIGRINSEHAFDLDQWYQVMVTIYEDDLGDHYGSLYVNAFEEAAFSTAVRPQNNGSFSLGQVWVDSSTSQHFKGRLDESVVFNRALTAAEVQERFSNPIFDLRLDESEGATSFSDESGFGHHAVCEGESCPDAEIEGVSNTAAEFDGYDYLSIAEDTSLDLSSGDFTISTWVFPVGGPKNPDCPFTAYYHSGSSYVFSRCEGMPYDYAWGAGAPAGLDPDDFHMGMEGEFYFEEGDYTFVADHGDSVRVELDDEIIIHQNRWYQWPNNHPVGIHSTSLHIEAGWHKVGVYYWEEEGDAYLNFYWTPAPGFQTQGILGANSDYTITDTVSSYPSIQREIGRVSIGFNTPDGRIEFTTVDTILKRDAWNHLAAVYDGTSYQVYVNGVAQDSLGVAGETLVPGDSFYVGRTSNHTNLTFKEIETLSASEPRYESYSGSTTGFEYVLQYRYPDGEWERIWSGFTAGNYEYTAQINVQEEFSGTIELNLYEDDIGEWALGECGGYSCPDDPAPEDMGLVSVTTLRPDIESHTALFSSQDERDQAEIRWSVDNESIPFRGKIDEVTIYKRAFSIEEITDIYNTGTLALHLRLNDPPGAADFIDEQGQHNGGCSGDHCPLVGVPGRDNQALWFNSQADGSSDYVTVDGIALADQAELTLATWFELKSTPSGDMRFVTLGDDSAVLGYQGGDLHFSLQVDGIPHDLQHNPALNADVWHHLVGVYDGSEMQMYLDGSLVLTKAVTGTIAGGDTLRLSADGLDTLDGLLDEVLVYHRALNGDELADLYHSVPQTLLHMDETEGASQFQDDSGNQNHGACLGAACPDSGLKGQLGSSAGFDGVDDVVVANGAAPADIQELSISTWVKLDSLPAGRIMRFVSLQNEKAVLRYDGIDGTGQLHFFMTIDGSIHHIRVNEALQTGYWYHVLGTYDGEVMELYLNGEKQGELSVSGTVATGADLYLSHADETLHGRLDEVTLYTRAVSRYDVRDLFRLQAKWVEDRQSHAITVDSETPASTLVLTSTYHADESFMMLVTSEDETSHVKMVEVGLSTDNGATYTWQSIPICQDALYGTAWCYIFEPVEGEGRYLLQTRATDAVGNLETPSTVYTLLVDDTPPQAAPAFGEDDILAAEAYPETANWYVGLSGTVNDPNLQTSGDPGSSIASILVKLTATDTLTDTLLPQLAEWSGTAWSLDYHIYDDEPTGSYTLTVQTTDNVGNTTELVRLVNIGLDASPPEASMDAVITPITDTITSTLTLNGQITETGSINIGVGGLQMRILPVPMASMSGTLAIFHLDEPAGSTKFNDAASGVAATCEGSACPTVGVPGVWGTAVSFDGNYQTADQYLSADNVTTAFSGTTGLAFGGWIKPGYNPDNRVVMAFNTVDGDIRNAIVHDDYTFRYKDGQVDLPIGSANQTWTHVMVSIDQDGIGSLFMNGDLVESFETSVRPDPEGRFSIGQEWDGDTPSDFFIGVVDELTLYDHALSPSEVFNLYVDTSLAASGEGVLSTTWAYTLPSTLDGIYQIDIRPEDAFSNTTGASSQWPAWTGEIDTRVPEIDFTITENQEKVAVAGLESFIIKTTYTCWARDFNLVGTSVLNPAYNFECPCQTQAPASTVITDTFYHEASPWYAAVYTQTNRLYERAETCTVVGPAIDNYMQACDIYGHCSSQIADIDSIITVIPSLYTAVLTPTHGTILSGAGMVNIEGSAYSRDSIRNVTVYDGGNLIGTPVNLTCPNAITDTQWTQTWLATEGQHYLSARVTDCDTPIPDTHSSSSIDVTVDSVQPVVTIFPLSLNRQQRLSYGRVALSGQVSDGSQGSGVTQVEVSVDGGNWADASIQGNAWKWEWYLGEEPDGAQYAVSVRATDRAGWQNNFTQNVTVDLDVPNPVTLTLTSDLTGAQDVPPGSTLREIPTNLELSWQASEPSDKLLNYQVEWNIRTATQTLQIPYVVLPTGSLSSSYPAIIDAQRIEPSVTSVFMDGNTQVDDWGPIYVDTPLTPDYIALDHDLFPYRGWMDSGCSQIGLDRRVAENAPGGGAISNPQNFYVTWDSEALRIAWTGANWDYAGDLFIYMSTDPFNMPITTAFNPFSSTQGIQFDLPGANAFVHVQDSQYATLYYWDGALQSTYLDQTQFRFDSGIEGGLTDLYIPFDLIGVSNPVGTPLVLYAFATEEDAMELWSAMPPSNPLNSGRVTEEDVYAGADYAFELLHFYAWPSLAPGICPNNSIGFTPLYIDSDLDLGLTVDPSGTTYNFMGDGLFWLWEDLSDPSRQADFSESLTFVDTDHPPVGHGETITYTLNFANNGTYTATGVTLQATGLFALELTGEVSETITITIGDLPPGASGRLSFQGQVDTTGPYNDCLSQGGDADTCAPFKDWANLQAVVYDSSHSIIGYPLDWLWADHRVDSNPPGFFGLSEPAYLIGTGATLFSGYAYDPSGVPEIALDLLQAKSPTAATQCQDSTPNDGVWSCSLDVTGVDGDEFNVLVRAEDGYGQSSEWSTPYTFKVDTVPPTAAFSPETTQTYSGTVVDGSSLVFDGLVSDNHGLGQVEVCHNGNCDFATLKQGVEPPVVTDDVPTSPIAITGATVCGVGDIVRTFVVSESFSLREVNLGFNADHDHRNDIAAALLSPNGTLVQVLFPYEGSPYNALNYDVLLRDAATTELHEIKADDNTASPFYDREIRPYESLGAFYGEDTAGTWTLTICDTNPAADHGSYNRAQLTLRPQNNAAVDGEWQQAETAADGLDKVLQNLTTTPLDRAGNRGDPLTLSFYIDNVAPVVTVTEIVYLTGTSRHQDAQTILTGSASDGDRVAQVYALVSTPEGDLVSLQVARSGGDWWFDFAPDEAGEYSIWINASDSVGNNHATGPYNLTAVQLLADNDGPTALGATTGLTATILGDDSTGYSYDWDFGDSTSASGQPETISHLYPSVGIYTATVTAKKGDLVLTAITHVTVDEAITGLIASNDSPTELGQVSTLTADISGGSNVEYSWTLGDGDLRQGSIVPHRYPDIGVYTATVTASNSVSVLTTTTQVRISSLTLINDSPTALGDTTTFTAVLSGGEVYTYTWDLGDGTPLFSNQLSAITATYASPGYYTAALMADTSVGTLTVTSQVTITGLVVQSDSPTMLGQATTLTATVFSVPEPITYTWDFGDGAPSETSSEAVVTHTYPTVGPYTAVVTATNSVDILTATTGIMIDNFAPTASISDPVAGQLITGTIYTVIGTAEDDVGLSQVEVSTDSGLTWHPALGTTTWTYDWTLPADENGITHTVVARAVDHAGFIGLSEPVTVTLDTAPPEVTAVIPLHLSTNVFTDTEVVVWFSEETDLNSLEWQSLPDPGSWLFVWDDDQLTITAAHAEFQVGVTYQITLDLRDLAGNPMTQPYSWQFTVLGSRTSIYLPLIIR